MLHIPRMTVTGQRIISPLTDTINSNVTPFCLFARQFDALAYGNALQVLAESRVIAEREQVKRAEHAARHKTEWIEELDEIEKPAIALSEVDPMSISVELKQKLTRYAAIVEQYESPSGYTDSGFTPREQELRRRRAHEELLAEMQRAGLDISVRAATTAWAMDVAKWIRED